MYKRQFSARFLLLGAGLGLSWLDLSPAENMWGQTASAVAQWVLIHVHASARTSITHQDVNIYFFMPSAFTTLRNTAKRYQIRDPTLDRKAGNEMLTNGSCHELVRQSSATNGSPSPDIIRRVHRPDDFTEQAKGPVIVAPQSFSDRERQRVRFDGCMFDGQQRRGRPVNSVLAHASHGPNTLAGTSGLDTAGG